VQSGRTVSPLDFSSVGHTGSRRASGHCVSRRDYSSSRLHRLYCAYVVHPDAPSRCSTSRQSAALALAVCPVILLCVVTTRLTAATDILRLRRTSGCLGTSRGSSRGPTRLSSTLTTSRVRVPRHVVRLVAPLVVEYFAYAVCFGASARRAARCQLLRLRRASGCLGTSCSLSRGSSSTTSSTPRVWVPQHVARLVTRLVVDYFDYAARPGASARRAARCRLLRLRRASGCLGTSRGSLSTSSFTSHVWMPRHITRLVAWLIVDNFVYTACSGASARRTACHAARRRLLRLRRVSGCLGTSRGSSRGSSRFSSSNTSPTPRVRVPRHVARLVTRLVVNYSVRRDFVLWPQWLYFSHAVRRDYLSRGNTGSTSSTSCTAATSSSGRIASTIQQQLVGINSD
jgi:hypothetical protein